MKLRLVERSRNSDYGIIGSCGICEIGSAKVIKERDLLLRIDIEVAPFFFFWRELCVWV